MKIFTRNIWGGVQLPSITSCKHPSFGKTVHLSRVIYFVKFALVLLVVLCLASCSWGFDFSVSTPKGEVGQDYNGKIIAVDNNNSFSQNTQVTYGIQAYAVKDKDGKYKRYQVDLNTTDGKTIRYESLSDLGLELSYSGMYEVKITGIPQQPGTYVFTLVAKANPGAYIATVPINIEIATREVTTKSGGSSSGCETGSLTGVFGLMLLCSSLIRKFR